MNKKVLNVAGIIVVVVLAILLSLYLNGFFKDKGEVENTNIGTIGDYYVDADGNGEKEKVVFITNEETGGLTKISIMGKDGKVAASTSDDIGFPPPFLESFETHKFATKSDIEFFSLDFIEGPHQARTIFMGAIDDTIYPICKTNETQSVFDCLFYNSNDDYLVVQDIDEDGFVEIIEYVDEYPEKAELTKEEEDAVNSAFDDKGKETVSAMLEITQREKGGKGRKVVWGIYAFDGQVVVPQEENDFFDYFFDLQENSPEIISKYGLSEELVKYQEMVQTIWLQGGL